MYKHDRMDMTDTMMTSSNGNIFRLTGHLCGEFTGSRVNYSHKGQWRGALIFSLICVWINGWVNNREAGDMRRNQAHYDVIVMQFEIRFIMSRQIKRGHMFNPRSDIGLFCALAHLYGETIYEKRHQPQKRSAVLALWGKSILLNGFPSQRDSNVKSVSMSWRHHGHGNRPTNYISIEFQIQ